MLTSTTSTMNAVPVFVRLPGTIEFIAPWPSSAIESDSVPNDFILAFAAYGVDEMAHLGRTLVR